MKVIRFTHEGTSHTGLLLDEGTFDLSAACEALAIPGPTDILSLLRAGRFHRAFFEEVLARTRDGGHFERFLIRQPVRPLLPYRPPKIIALGLNYVAHAAESGFQPPEEPVIFTKASTCVIGPDEPIRIKKKWGRIDPEVELAVVIGRRAKDVLESEANDYVAGYSILNDVTARAMQSADFAKTAPWFRSKSIDTFGPFGPCIVTAEAIPTPVELNLQLTVNGQMRQRDNTRNLIFGIPTLIAFISDLMTLEPGDVISTGTPEGIGEIGEGDVVACQVEGIGVLRNPVVAIPD